MLGILLGIVTIGLGLKGFSATGLPWSRQKQITGTPAKVIGVICILLGIALIAEGAWSMWRMAAPRDAASQSSLPVPPVLMIETSSDWQRQLTDDHRCSAEFPEPANRTTIDFDGSLVRQLVFRRRSDGEMFSLESSAAPSGKRESFALTEIVDDFRDRLQQMAQSGNYVFEKLDQESITRDKVPGIRLTYRIGERSLAISEFFLQGETLYRANVALAEADQDISEVERFFASIRFKQP